MTLNVTKPMQSYGLCKVVAKVPEKPELFLVPEKVGGSSPCRRRSAQVGRTGRERSLEGSGLVLSISSASHPSSS